MTEQLNVNLSQEVVYVYGAVNGVEAEWSLTAPGIWSAVVPKAEDGRYVICITAYNSLGTPTTYETVISRIDDLIPLKTDWGPDDDYGPEDLNRVEANTQYIAEYLEDAGYPAILESVKVDRDVTGYEFGDSLSRVERNVDALTKGFMAPPGYQTPKAWSAGMRHSYVDANRLEQNLQLIHEWALGVVASFKRCGTFACGEDGGIY